MDQIGVHMDFLQIKQVSGIKYALKIYFPINFSDFLILWTAPQIQRSAGAVMQESLRHGVLFPRTAGCLNKKAGAHLQNRYDEGAWAIPGRPI